MALLAYKLGDTVLLAFVVVDNHDPAAIVCEMSNGDRHHFTDAQIKLAGISPNPAGTILQDTTSPAAPPQTDLPPDQSVANPA